MVGANGKSKLTEPCCEVSEKGERIHLSTGVQISPGRRELNTARQR